jgi:hypothetical protein
VTSGERTLNVLKHVKECYVQLWDKHGLNGFATLTTNCDLAQKLDLSSIINIFSEERAKKNVH